MMPPPDLSPVPDLRTRYFTDPEYHAAVEATRLQARRDGADLDPEYVCKVLMAFDRSGIGALIK